MPLNIFFFLIYFSFVLLQKLLTMLPTEEERSRIQEAQAANPDLPLGSAEQFLLTLASISELPARLKLWAFKLDFENSEKVRANDNFLQFQRRIYFVKSHRIVNDNDEAEEKQEYDKNNNRQIFVNPGNCRSFDGFEAGNGNVESE